MPSSRDDIPNSRLARTAMLGGLVAEQTARYAGTAAANLARPRARRRLAVERRHLDAADQMLAVLGAMKGPAMKAGQMLSFMDLGLLPEDVRPRFQQRLATLCAEAPHIPWTRMEPVITRVLGRPISEVFSEFDQDPIGTASIGQVYRAVTRGGLEVAVKVQYPDIVAAARADLKNLGVILRLGQSLAPSVDTVALGRELSTRFLEELDYENEARNTALMASAYKDHPFICVPAPVTELCGAAMLVTEYVHGRTYDQVCASDQANRDRVGEIIGRFYLGGLFNHGIFSGDPHPGNLIALTDGRVAFVDFGSIRRLTASQQQFVRSTVAGIVTGEMDGLLEHLSGAGILTRPDGLPPEVLKNFLVDTCGWFLADTAVTMTPQITSDAIVASVSPASQYQGSLAGQDLPVEWALLIRSLIATSALLGQLNATGNWYRVVREWAFDEPASTPLGEQERAFAAG